jgi:hypothetical protein
VLAGNETPQAADANLGLLRIQNMIDAWAADRLTLSVQLKTTFVLLSGVSTVTVGTGGTVPITRPVWLNHLSYNIPGSSPAVEVPIALLDEDSFAQLSIKLLQSTLPEQAFYNTRIQGVFADLTFWPVSTQNITVNVYSPQSIDVPASLNTVILGPSGAAEALMYNLAVRLWPPFRRPDPVPQELKDSARDTFATFKKQNVSPGLLAVDAGLTLTQTGGRYNVLSDTGG